MSVKQYFKLLFKNENHKRQRVIGLVLCLVIPLVALVLFSTYSKRHERQQLEHDSVALESAFEDVLGGYQKQLYQWATSLLYYQKWVEETPVNSVYWVQGDVLKAINNSSESVVLTDLLPLIAEAQDSPFVFKVYPALSWGKSGHFFIPMALGVHDKRAHVKSGVILMLVPVEEWVSRLAARVSLSQMDYVLLNYQRQPIFASKHYDMLLSEGYMAANMQLHQMDELDGYLPKGIVYRGMNLTYYGKISGHPLIVLTGIKADKATSRDGIKIIAVMIYYVAILGWLYFKRRKSKHLQVEATEYGAAMKLTREQLMQESTSVSQKQKEFESIDN